MSEARPVRRRSTPTPGLVRRVWREYRVEMLGALVAGFGLFLLFERLSIRKSLAAWFRTAIVALLSGFRQFDGQVGRFLARVSLSDVVGACLLLAAFVGILLRVRWRLLSNSHLTSGDCPKCGGPIQRVHRKWLDRVICLYVPVRRYCCHDPACHWRGLRVGRHHGSTRRKGPAPS